MWFRGKDGQEKHSIVIVRNVINCVSVVRQLRRGAGHWLDGKGCVSPGGHHQQQQGESVQQRKHAVSHLVRTLRHCPGCQHLSQEKPLCHSLQGLCLELLLFMNGWSKCKVFMALVCVDVFTDILVLNFVPMKQLGVFFVSFNISKQHFYTCRFFSTS